jgi:hypothetical protein
VKILRLSEFDSAKMSVGRKIQYLLTIFRRDTCSCINLGLKRMHTYSTRLVDAVLLTYFVLGGCAQIGVSSTHYIVNAFGHFPDMWCPNGHLYEGASKSPHQHNNTQKLMQQLVQS